MTWTPAFAGVTNVKGFMRHYTSVKFQDFVSKIINFIFPPFCLGCGDYLGIGGDPQSLCRLCFENLRTANQDFFHWAKESNALDSLWSLAPYGSEPLTTLIHKIKYQNKNWILNSIAPVLSEALPLANFENFVDVIVPVPIHRGRLKERGFNQAELIAQAVGKILSKPVCSDALFKIRKTKPQMNIKDRKERWKNVSGTIKTAESISWKEKRVLLIDDVYTTGATMAECAKALRVTGAARVFGFTLARGGL